MKLWHAGWGIMVFLCLALLCSALSIAGAEALSAFEYVSAYHDAETEDEKDALIHQAYEAKGDEPLKEALELLYSGPFPSDFRKSVVEDFIERFQKIVPPDASYAESPPTDEKQDVQVLMKMSGIGYAELFDRGLEGQVWQSPNAIVRLWLEDDPLAWPEAIPHLAPEEDFYSSTLRIPEERLDESAPWGVDIKPDDQMTVQMIYVGKGTQEGSTWSVLELDMLSRLAKEHRPKDPWQAMYVIVIREKTEEVGSYTNGKGAFRHDLFAEVYRVDREETVWTSLTQGASPPMLVTGDQEGHGEQPDRKETGARAVENFIRVFIEKMI